MKSNLYKLREEILQEILKGFDISLDDLKAECIIDVEELIDLAIKKDREAILKDFERKRMEIITPTMNDKYVDGINRFCMEIKQLLKPTDTLKKSLKSGRIF